MFKSRPSPALLAVINLGMLLINEFCLPNPTSNPGILGLKLINFFFINLITIVAKHGLEQYCQAMMHTQNIAVIRNTTARKESALREQIQSSPTLEW